MVLQEFNLGVQENAVVLANQDRSNKIEISFQRTVRVPDNKKISSLPPDLGRFPLYKVKDFNNNLPTSVAEKGGVFLPIYQREALWINFEASSPFIVKIYAGNVNVISGQMYQEDFPSILERQNAGAEAKSLQDYIVVPQQQWLDGIATAPGIVGQFCAVPSGSHYSVEAQLTGQDAVSGLMFEITPAKTQINRELASPMQIFIRSLTGAYEALDVTPIMNVGTLKEEIEKKEGIPVDQQRLIFEGKGLNDEDLLWHRGVKQSSTIYLVARLRGGGLPNDSTEPSTPSPPTLSLAKGGRIKQSIQPDVYDPKIWHPAHTLAFNVHLINSRIFPSVTGAPAPSYPITALTYAAAGLPFFDMEEEQSTIHGGTSFAPVKSIAEIENKTNEEVDINPRLVQLDSKGRRTMTARATVAYKALKEIIHDPDGLLDPTGPLTEFRTLSDLKEQLAKLCLKMEN